MFDLTFFSDIVTRESWCENVTAVSILLAVICVLLSIYCYNKQSERKDTLMKRIRQTYIRQGPSWRSDCEYVISYPVTDNTQETNTEEPAEELVLIDESSSVHCVSNDDELVKALNKRDTEKRVLFVGEPGMGKSHLFRSIASKWAKGKILEDAILIYLQLDHVPREACILKEFLKLMKRENSATEIYSLFYKLQLKKSIVMLDGISNWARYCNTTSNIANRNENVLTVEELLEPNKKGFQHMTVWVTSRNVDADMKVMKGNYTKVKLNELNEKQRKNFFQKFLEMEKCGNKIWNLLSRKWQRQSKRELIDNWDNYITKTCSNLLITRCPVFVRYLATLYCSDKQSIDETYFKDFKDFNDCKGSKEFKDFKDFKDKNIIKATTDILKLKIVDFDLLVCLLEVGSTDDDIYRICAMMLHLEKLVFNHFKDEYFQEAKLRLLKTLKEKQVAITSLTIYGDFPIKLLSCLPEIEKRLVIYNVRFTKIDFLDVVKTLQHQNCILQFHNSKIPATIPVNELLDQCSTTNLSVFHYKETNSYQLSWEEGVWKKVYIEVGHHQSVADNRPKEQNNEQTEASHRQTTTVKTIKYQTLFLLH